MVVAAAAAAAHIGGNSKQGRPQRLGEDMVSVSEDGEIEVLGIGRSLCDRGGEELIKEKGHSHDPQRKFFLTGRCDGGVSYFNATCPKKE